VGMMMAELIDNVQNHNLDHDNHPYPFELPKTGITIDMSFFSRNRELNPDSSYSVNG
jgi:sarcosine oxidase subunit beta